MVQVIILNLALVLIFSAMLAGYYLFLDEYLAHKYNFQTLFEKLGLENHNR